MSYDTLTYNGLEKTFAAWGIDLNKAILIRRNFRTDTFSAYFPQISVTADPTFPFEAVITVRTGRQSATGADNSFGAGTIKFTGKRVGFTGNTEGKKSGVSYIFEGPWYDLSNTHYLQTFKGSDVNPFFPGEVVFNTSTASTVPGAFLFISVGDQIQAILQWILDQYAAQGMTAPFQYTGRALNAGKIDLTTAGTATVGVNTDKAGNLYNAHVVSTPTIDATLYGTFLVSYIAKPMMCATALQKMLELSPRTNICFDYSTAIPTILVKSIDNFPSANLQLFNGVDHMSLSIKRRDDLVARSVVITYKIMSTVDGAQVLNYAVDKWGPHGFNNVADPNAGLRVFSDTLDLQGFSITTTTAQLDCEPLLVNGASNATKRAWWTSRRGGEQAKFADSRLRFQNNTFAETTIPNATITYATTDVVTGRVAGAPLSGADLALFTNRIVKGTHHIWMTIGSPAVAVAVQAIKVRISVKTEHAIYDVPASGDTLGQLPGNESASNTAVNGNRQGKVNTEETHMETELTNAFNAGGQIYTTSTITSSTPGELYIVGQGGIAQYLFNSLAALQYDGEYAKVETDFANNVSLANCINFTNGRTEWATMNAQAQEIEENFGSKETRVRIGVSNDLTAGQLSSLLNMWAFRRPWYNPAVRADNTLANSGQVTMPTTAGSANGTDGIKNHSDWVTTNYAVPGDPTSTVNGQVKATASKINDILSPLTVTPVDPAIKPHVIDPKEIAYCDASGDTIYAVTMVGGFYMKS